MKNAIVTGATKGIGLAIAIALAKQGINLAICSRNLKDLQKTQAYLLSANPDINVHIAVADVSDKQELLKFATFAEEKLRQVNILINNVGIYITSSILNDNENTFDDMLNANLRPAYELYRYFGKKAGQISLGHIFNICSVAALNPVTEAGMYTVTKAATLSLSNIMRMEMRPLGVKVTSVIPGSTLTSSWDGVPTDKDKFVLPEDIAAAVSAIYNMSAGANVDELIITPLAGQQ